MAYSNNPITLERMLPDLRPLCEGATEVTWRVNAGQAQWWAHRLREALRLARRLRSAPTGLKRQFVTRVLSETVVRVSLKQQAPERDLSFDLDPLDTQSQEERAKISSRIHALVDVTESEPNAEPVEWVRQLWYRAISQGESKLYLPRAGLARSELLELHAWTQTEGLIFFEDEGSLTLMLRLGNESAAAYAWSPEDA